MAEGTLPRKYGMAPHRFRICARCDVAGRMHKCWNCHTPPPELPEITITTGTSRAFASLTMAARAAARAARLFIDVTHS